MTAKKPIKKPAPRKVSVVIPKCLLDDIRMLREQGLYSLQNSIDALHRLRVAQDQRMMEHQKLQDEKMDGLTRLVAEQSVFIHKMLKLHILLVQRFSAALDTRYPLTRYLEWRDQQRNPTRVPTLERGLPTRENARW